MRVNGSLLAQCVNKRVSLFGTVQLIHPSNMEFNIMTSDNYNVTVNLQKPVGDHVSGLVEVHGICQGPSSIACDHYIVFPPSVAQTYDGDIDNNALRLAFRLPNNAWH